MKITTKQIQNIINEELDKVLLEIKADHIGNTHIKFYYDQIKKFIKNNYQKISDPQDLQDFKQKVITNLDNMDLLPSFFGMFRALVYFDEKAEGELERRAEIYENFLDADEEGQKEIIASDLYNELEILYNNKDTKDRVTQALQSGPWMREKYQAGPRGNTSEAHLIVKDTEGWIGWFLTTKLDYEEGTFDMNFSNVSLFYNKSQQLWKLGETDEEGQGGGKTINWYGHRVPGPMDIEEIIVTATWWFELYKYNISGVWQGAATRLGLTQ